MSQDKFLACFHKPFAAACLSFSLVAGTGAIVGLTPPAAHAQELDPGSDELTDEQPETSSWETSSIATDETSVLARSVDALSLVIAVGGVIGISASLIMHFAAMALPDVP